MELLSIQGVGREEVPHNQQVVGRRTQEVVLQLHYFHRPFMQLTDPEHRPLPGACTPRWVPG